MTLNEWEQNNIEVLTSREMGEWLGRRENRVLEQIRAEIEHEGAMFPDGEFFVSIDRINEIIDKHME